MTLQDKRDPLATHQQKPRKKTRKRRPSRVAVSREVPAPEFSLRKKLRLTLAPLAETPEDSSIHVFWKILLFALPVYYFLAFGRYGFTERDDGFVLAYAWRVINGQLPHRDFISVRPAMPAYVHALSLLLMPESLEILFDRFLNYVMAAASNFFLFAALQRWVPLERFHLNVYAMAALGFIYSVHNFPPMAWTSTDGIFFFSLGLYLLTRGDAPKWIATGMIAVLAGLLTKQSFIAMPFMAIVVVFVLYGRQAAVKAIGVLAAVSLILTGVGAMLGILTPMIHQTTNTTGRGNVFIYSGLFPYFEKGTYFLPLLLFSAARLLVLRDAKKSQYLCTISAIAVSIALIFETIDNYTAVNELLRRLAAWLTGGFLWHNYGGKSLGEIFQSFVTHPGWKNGMGFNIPFHAVRSLMWLGVVTAVLTLEPRKVPGSILPLYALVLAWSCSATNGYPTPALCSGPLVFAIFHAGVHLMPRKASRAVLHILLWGGLAVYSFANCFPYQSKPIWCCTHHMGDIFRKATGIYADDKAWRTYSELKQLASEYGPNFKTLPNVPLANYLTNTIPPIGVDWVEDYELPGEWRDVAAQLDASGAAVFVRKDLMESELLPYYAFGGINSTVTFYVTKTWKKVKVGKEFDVYMRDAQSTSSLITKPSKLGR